MKTIRESIAIAEPHHDELTFRENPSIAVPVPAHRSRERELALHIRLTASSLVGIALIDRNPDPEPSR
jgi:hypothetical protein